MNKSKVKNVLIRIPEDVYLALKESADFRYTTVTHYILQSVIEKIAREKQFD
jgi:uncharacterized protein (DUF1778 family)